MRAGFLLFLVATLSCARAADAPEPRYTIEQLTSIFENDTPRLQYTYCQNIRDRRGYTFGFVGFTSGTFDGTMFLQEYIRLNPDNPLAGYLPAFQAIDAGPHDDQGRNPSLAGLSGFPSTFRSCANDPAFIQAQQDVANDQYWLPSQRIARHIGATLPITRGELYDTYINQGEDGAEELVRETNRAMGSAPKNGSDERAWLAKFLEFRMALLSSDPTWKNSLDRIRVYQRLLEQGNVGLRKPIHVFCYGDRFTLK